MPLYVKRFEKTGRIKRGTGPFPNFRNFLKHFRLQRPIFLKIEPIFMFTSGFKRSSVPSEQSASGNFPSYVQHKFPSLALAKRQQNGFNLRSHCNSCLLKESVDNKLFKESHELYPLGSNHITLGPRTNKYIACTWL